jgi:uncharacterized repeat protein (TIGR01451 family)
MKTQKYLSVCGILWFYCFLLSNLIFGIIDGKKLTIGDSQQQGGAPYFYATLDAAGYSDWIFYGNSPSHNYSYHEILSGEWGSAAIYYDGIDTPIIDPNTGERQAMWLTKDFEYPYWVTNSQFTTFGTCEATSSPNNPTPLMDTGQSAITNGDVEITIYYEVVDLEPLAGDTYSPMSYIVDPNSSTIGYMYSDRYVFLQTYVIRNIKSQTLTNLEFYQFLHSHGADDYGPYVNSTYCDANLQDPLAGYVPYNSVHCALGSNTAGNFRYDITQWNGPKTQQNHTDYISFSSTVEPNWIDNDVYPGGHTYGYYKPPIGTHLHIENCQLNGIDHIYNAEVGGAMGWMLGSLDPNESVSMTIAFMFGPQQETSDLVLTKTDNVDPQSCVQPNDSLTYTISWQNIGLTDAENAVLTDYLPAGVDYNYILSVSPLVIDPNYNAEDHSYTWQIGTIPASGSGSRQLTVTVNDKAEPGMQIQNRAVLIASIGQVSAEWSTDVCCWDTGDIIYVDRQATGDNIGTSWQNAYTDLQSALVRAAIGCGQEIWVAQGTYDPGRLADTTFIIPAGVSVYGGFAGTETSCDQRSPKRYKTILTGAADTERNDTVVTMEDETILDGFTVTGASVEGYGIYGYGADFTIENCIVEKNENYGVRAQGGNVTVKWCEIRNNRQFGIWHQGADFTLTVENSQVRNNSEYGIYCVNSTPIVKNSTASENDLEGKGRAGIRLFNPKYSPVLYNNTFAYNRSQGIYFTDNGTISDPNDKDWPDVQNCILWKNNGGIGEQFSGFSKSLIQYSCIYDPNDPEGENTQKDANLNFTTNPKFAYYDPNNLHLAYDSPCKEAGSLYLSYSEQVDMDSESRVVGDYVDVGADELYSCDGDYSEDDFYNALDWNSDGVVNMVEFTRFSKSWLAHDPNDPYLPTDPNLIDPNDFVNWNPMCDLDPTGDSAYSIDLADLDVFIADTPWLWEACWRDNYIEMYGLTGGGESMLVLSGAEGMMGMSFSEPYEYEEENTYADMSLPELTQFIQGIHEVIAQLEILIDQDSENAENASELKAFLEGVLLDIEKSLQ